jgi:hypothetical protein
MSTVESAGYKFASHVRQGLVALDGVAAGGRVNVTALLSDGTQSSPVTLLLPGVGEVEPVKDSPDVRKYPLPDIPDAETEFFPLIEFREERAPWMVPTLTGPYGPIPWVCLVAVEMQDGISISSQGPGKPDVLRVESPAMPGMELPDPATSPLWVSAFAPTTVQNIDGAEPVETGSVTEYAGSRFVAPRRMKPQTTYLACLVPTFAASALAGSRTIRQ